jgi:guanylate kinase
MSKVIVVTGPSAVGKTYLADLLVSTYAEHIISAKVVTTREPRQGETGTDRIFVSKEAFTNMLQHGEFIVEGEFGGNQYGYTAEALEVVQHKKSIIINTWPAMIPAFEKIKNVLLVGLTVDTGHLPLLEERLLGRSESSDILEKRKQLIRADVQTMLQYRDNIASCGRTFYIHDDTSIHTDVLPFILDYIQR